MTAVRPRILGTLAALALGCGVAETVVPAGSGGAAGSTTTGPSSGGATGSGGTGGAASCDACTPDAPICVDAMACAAMCPGGRDLCHPADAPPGGSCCVAGQQCCEAGVFGYSGGDLCRPDAEACPLGCPGSTDVCPLDTYCTLDPQSGQYACKPTCQGDLVCGFNMCCPVGTRCLNDACPAADLAVDAARIAATAHVDVVNFAPDSCELFEACVGAPGNRTLLRFDLRIPNIGAGDLYLGNPEGNPLFQYSPCHKHYHFSSFADYRLLDKDGKEVAFGHKQAFCLEDAEPDTDPPKGDPLYSCKFQGVQAGWADVYEAKLPCQWVDVTGVPPGSYTLHVAINYAKILMEASFDNNKADVPVVIPPNTCPGGCKRVDAKCCQPGDPCGWAENGSCDCSDHFGWDTADCAACIPPDQLCLADSTCPAGCTENSGPCCADGDPCGLANNFACDCEDKFAWDTADCKGCNNPDPPCPANTCPNGCTAPGQSPQCCAPDNPCGWGADGFCDCSGLYDWDAKDCAHCTTVSPSCP